MKMKLSVKDRVVLLGFIPKEGNLLFVKMVQQLLEDLSFSDSEEKTLGFYQKLQGQVMWDEEAAENINKEIEIPDTLRDQIISKLNKFNNNNKLTPDHISLCEKFDIS